MSVYAVLLLLLLLADRTVNYSSKHRLDAVVTTSPGHDCQCPNPCAADGLQFSRRHARLHRRQLTVTNISYIALQNTV